MRPSPLLAQHFFCPGLPNPMMKKLCEDPRKLGIGSTTGVRGLSALEGIVAAIEVCVPPHIGPHSLNYGDGSSLIFCTIRSPTESLSHIYYMLPHVHLIQHDGLYGIISTNSIPYLGTRYH